MENKTQFGINRTGVQMSPLDSDRLIEFSQSCKSDIKANPSLLEKTRNSFIYDENNIGSVPLPGTLKGIAKTAKQKLTGTAIETFIDKLGERLAFERSGVRLYDAIKNKVKVLLPNKDLLKDVSHFRDEEFEHFMILVESMKELGADPTAQTPSASVVGVSSFGILTVITDPQTTLAQSLNALLTAELTDNVGWELLIELAKQTEQSSKMLELFRQAFEQEQDHLIKIKFHLEQEMLKSL